MQVKDLFFTVAVFAELLLHCRGETRFYVLEGDAVLRPFWARKRRLDLLKLELEHVRENGIWG